MAITITVKVPGIDRMLAKLSNNPKMGDAIANAWSLQYRSFTRLRFHRLSRGGGGEWPPLKQTTINRRRKGRGKGSPAILRDTGALFASFQPGVSGGILQSKTLRPIGVKITLGGGESYSGGTKLSDVATFHHEGKGRLPKRELLVLPPAAEIKKMAAVSKKIIVSELNER